MGSVPSPRPKLPKWLFETEAAPTAAFGQVCPSVSDLQRELDRVWGRSMVRWSDRAARSKSMNRLTAMDSAAAAESGSEGETVRKVLFPDEAETSRRCEQRRRELIHQHENPRKPMPLMDLNVEVCLDLNVKVRSEKWSKSMNRLTGHLEKEECTRTVRFIPAGSESTVYTPSATGSQAKVTNSFHLSRPPTNRRRRQRCHQRRRGQPRHRDHQRCYLLDRHREGTRKPLPAAPGVRDHGKGRKEDLG